jgi:hypothetical protein
MRPLVLALALLASACPLFAGYRVIGRALPERFDEGRRAWSSLPVLLEFDAAGSTPRLRFSALPLGRELTARLDFKRLPHYGEWLAQRQAQGGPAWTALKAILDELGNGPCMALTHEKLSADSACRLLLGMRRGSRFDLYASVPGRLSACGKDLCFEPGEPVFASHSASLAWDLLRPLALKQAKSAASRCKH